MPGIMGMYVGLFYTENNLQEPFVLRVLSV